MPTRRTSGRWPPASGSRQVLSREEVGRIFQPVMVAIGTRDAVAGAAAPLVALLPDGTQLDIPSRDHNPAVGGKVFKQGALDFLKRQPAGEDLSPRRSMC